MEDKYTDNALINMISLSEEISSLNVKVKQLVEDVHADKPLLVNLKELTRELNQKIGELNKSVNSYKPREVPETDAGTPSYVSANKERERVEPGPGDPVPYDTTFTPVPAKVDAGGPLPIEELVVKKEEIKNKPPRKATPRKATSKRRTSRKTNKKAAPKRGLFNRR